jgi:hypothetical protein
MVEEKDCDLAPTLKPLNGTVACTNGKKTNSKCTITCDEGFTIRFIFASKPRAQSSILAGRTATQQ